MGMQKYSRSVLLYVLILNLILLVTLFGAPKMALPTLKTSALKTPAESRLTLSKKVYSVDLLDYFKKPPITF
jgi:hypothetical protein